MYLIYAKGYRCFLCVLSKYTIFKSVQPLNCPGIHSQIILQYKFCTGKYVRKSLYSEDATKISSALAILIASIFQPIGMRALHYQQNEDSVAGRLSKYRQQSICRQQTDSIVLIYEQQDSTKDGMQQLCTLSTQYDQYSRHC